MKRFLIGVAAFSIGMFLLLVPAAAGCGVLHSRNAVWDMVRSITESPAENREKPAGVTAGRGSAGDADITEKKKIALTFDDGPSPEYTKQLLDGLTGREAKVTFFVLGERASRYPDLVKREADEGHLVGNHSYRHEQLNKLTKEEAYETIGRTNDVIESLTGREVDFIRPPYGEWDKSFEDGLYMIPVFWTVDPRDWDCGNADEIIENVVTNVKENDIILMHDDYQSSVDAALGIIDILTKQGYEFVTVEELIMN